MGDAQTLDEFNAAMLDAAKVAYPSAEWIWIEELGASAVILAVEKAGDEWGYDYYRHGWSITDGAPQLDGNPTEMIRVSRFEPKTG